MKRVVIAAVVALVLGVAAYVVLPRMRTIAPAASTPPPASPPQALTGDALRQFESWYQAQPRLPVPVSNEGAAVLIVKFTDYQCPGCAWTHTAYAPVLTKWQAQHPGAVKAVSKQYPLDPACNPTVQRLVHPAACEAAIAVLLTPPGQRVQMEDWLYANRDSLAPQAVQQAATNIAHVDSQGSGRAQALDEIRDDAQVGRMLGVSSTPTYFVNGVKLLRDGKLMQPEELDAAIAFELRRAGIM